MKFFGTLAASFLGLAAVSFAAPFADPDAAEAYELIQREAGKAGVEVVVRTAETGDVSIGLTPRGDDDEDFSGEIVEKPNGTLVFYDEAGKEHSIDELVDLAERGEDAAELLAERGLGSLIKGLGKLKPVWPVIKKYGKRAIVRTPITVA
ncbi:hypothetical protein JX265_012960 [Neoarthrinium moseri]|uniref:Uncharacterized protein n=1 Tax=Neoarthrinium moseri TaxID=1658444 RepID=A0A9P9W9V7_9PEZI|nr:hypothetical protein JX265_012960 [Neoarthrinium moseri]